MSEGLKRHLVALIAIPIIFYSVYQGGLYFLAIVCFISFVGQYEYYSIARQKGLKPLTEPAYASGLAILVSCYFGNYEMIVIVFLIYLIIAFSGEVFRKIDEPFASTAISIMGLIYPTLSMATMILIRELHFTSSEIAYQTGAELIILLFVGVWASDTGAYYIGKKFGRHKLIPRVSPKKTWEGSIAGLVAAVVFTYLFRELSIGREFLSITETFIIGALAGSLGQVGDLYESLIKRDAGVKDSGSILPGHGGMLDRFDALLFVSPAVFIYLSVIF